MYLGYTNAEALQKSRFMWLNWPSKERMNNCLYIQNSRPTEIKKTVDSAAR